MISVVVEGLSLGLYFFSVYFTLIVLFIFEIMSTDVLEAAVMLETLRVTELRLLLSKMGKSKSGLKKDLQKRVTDLLHNDCSPELLSAVRELHDLRQISKSRRSGIEIISMPESLSPGGTPSPKSAGPQMIKLPFYQMLETIIPPTPLVPTYGGAMQNSDFLFHLSESQQALIQNSRSSQPVQVVLRICYSESIGVEEDQYPPNICVSVNHNNCPVQCTYSSNKLGLEPSRPCRPIDITSDLYLSFTNRFTVLWGNFGKSYSVAVYLVRLVSCQQLLDQLRSSSVEQQDVCRLRVSEKLRSDPETEVATTGLQVSLICPLVKLRMSVPCRSRGCAHLQCFDASFYLQMNEKKPRWSCPVCHRYAPFDELRIDSLLRDVLESSGEDVEEIKYLSDSTWKAVKHDKSNQNKGSALHPVKHNVNSKPVRDAVVDLTQSSSDDEDFQKEETVSTHIEDKSVHFRKSGIVKSARHKGRKTQVHTEKHRNGN
ncbi:E3 SUMO-protein ligase PIAS4b isoform 1 [Danio rerio]|uniref:E3 SUMO-protein ligase PIAS4b isoform 1 n=2 Tax=Danio rerio TaxID=7955 RepID=F8W4B9_DANRE|nr:E3 SUMO-protein ligase PIAS4b isoform 1 [Danio rerio]|eukprot:NP_956637.2 protein inhibitor of activated STAT, 4b isoform 1 [Danio rerio]